MSYYLFTFHSTHDAIASKQYLECRVSTCIMPTLREISNSCGISIRVKEEDFKKASDLMKQGVIKKYNVYCIQDKQVTCIEKNDV